MALPALGQTAREPVDLLADVAVSIQGQVPYAAGAGAGRAMPGFDDSEWGTLAVPGIRGGREVPAEGWYRIHLRSEGWSLDELGVAVPPVYGAWSLWFNGSLVASQGSDGEPASDRWRVVTVDSHLVLPQSNLLALHVVSVQGLQGIGGELRIGPAQILRSTLDKRRGLSLGLAVAFLLLGIFALVLAAVDRDRFSALLAATLLALAAAGGTRADWWYLFFGDPDTRLHLHAALFLLMHAGALFLAEQLFVGRPDRGARAGALISVAAAAVSVALPLGALFELTRLAWTLTGAATLYVIYLGRGLPLRSPVVRAGVRAGFLGLFLVLAFEVSSGSWGLPGAGLFELGFLILVLTVAAVFALTQARARRRAMSVLRSSRDGLAVLDLFGRVVHVNPALLQMFGVGDAVLTRGFIDERLSGDDPARLDELVDSLAAARVGAEPESMVVPIRGASGAELVVDVLGVRLDDMHLLLSLRDVTERSRLEREVARAQRLDSLGMLAGGIAHDFNNLLAGILIAASELEREESLPPAVVARAHSISEAARRGGALTNRLLQFARGRVSPTVGVNLESELPDMLDMLARTLGRNLEWSIDVEADLPPVRVDEAELEQILVNLCVNARDAMAPGGGRITVRAWTSRDGEEAVVGLQIADDGPGMSETLLARVIEPFVTTKGSGAGTGLGLAVVHGLVSARGGTMTIESAPGEGTRVTLTLPVLDDEPAVEVATPAAAPSLGDFRVLLVEDEPTLRSFLCRALERRGVQVDVLDDGEAVMPWIAAHHGSAAPVDAVVMDMMMPVVDGMQASNALREVWPGIPVVISSGYTGRESIEPLLESGPTLLLEKPYQVDDLMAALARVVG